VGSQDAISWSCCTTCNWRGALRREREVLSEGSLLSDGGIAEDLMKYFRSRKCDLLPQSL